LTIWFGFYIYVVIISSILYVYLLQLLFSFLILLILFYPEKNHLTYAHIFIDTPNIITKNIDKYQVVFLPYPNIPLTNDNSTKLNFSLMEKKTDVYNVFLPLITKDRRSGNVVQQIL
jgi:hypothetical protein